MNSNDTKLTVKPINEKLRDFMDAKGYTNKDLARIFGYAEPNISDFLQGKSADNSKLHVIVKLFLDLKELQDKGYSEQEVTKLCDKISNLEKRIAYMEGQLSERGEALKRLEDIFNNLPKNYRTFLISVSS